MSVQKQTVICSECSRPPTLDTNEYGVLSVTCECETRDVKVSEVIPDGWSE